MNRREFLVSTAAFAGLAGCKVADGSRYAARPSKVGGRMLIGACRPNSDAALMKSIGYDFIEGKVEQCFAPEKGDEEWKRLRDEILALPLPLRCCNCFLPGTFRITGPNADFAPALDYGETALRRAAEVGVNLIVFGSNGARTVPGDPLGITAPKPDTEKGLVQFTDFCRILCERVKDLDRMELLVEPLRPNGDNIINFVWQAEQVCRDVDSPRLKLIADLFHMMAGRERPRSLVEAKSFLRHCHIADYGTRNFVGEKPETVWHMKPYFDTLKSIGFSGGVSCEPGKGGWGEPSDLAKNLETTLKTLKSLV